ncbi:MAG: PD-(D/E)XK nuclease family protein, partial [Chloroflexota bacterium]
MTDGFTMVEAPEAPEEVQAVWRKIKRLLLSGVRPDDILVAVRDWGRYYPHMERYTYAYDLPVLLHYGDPLANNPAIAVLMTTLMLAGNDPESPSAFRRRPLLDVLRSPYIAVPGITDEMIDALDLISHEQQVLGGRQNWLNAIDAASDEYYDEDGELQEAIIDLEFGMEISVALEAFFEKITPDQSATHQDYVAWLEDLIGEDPVNDPDDRVEDLDVETIAIQPHDTYTLNIPTCIRNLPTTAHADRILRRDVAAMNQFKEILRGILTVQEFLRGVLRDSTKQLSWRDFLADLQTGVKNDRPVQRHPGRSGRVLVTTATDARGLPHDHMFILGLSEGIFPADIPEDPLYLDTERKALSERGVTLQTQAERADDSGIFYELISQARQSLTLSRPHVRDGKQWVESHLWRMSKDVFADLPVQHIGIGEIPTADTIATLAEAEITLAHRLSSNTRDETTRQLHQWITQTDAQRWQRINQGRTLETGRLSSGSPYDPATGYIQHPDILEIIADTIDTDYTWSATRLSSYGACPYRFFASYMLKLSSLDELEEGMDVLQRGTLNHSILEKTYRAIRDEGIVITPDNRLDAIDILHEI